MQICKTAGNTIKSLLCLRIFLYSYMNSHLAGLRGLFFMAKNEFIAIFVVTSYFYDAINGTCHLQYTHTSFSHMYILVGLTHVSATNTVYQCFKSTHMCQLWIILFFICKHMCQQWIILLFKCKHMCQQWIILMFKCKHIWHQ